MLSNHQPGLTPLPGLACTGQEICSSPSPSCCKAWGSVAVDKPLTIKQGWVLGICASSGYRSPSLLPSSLPSSLPPALPPSFFSPSLFLPLSLFSSFILPFLSSSFLFSFPPFLPPSFSHFSTSPSTCQAQGTQWWITLCPPSRDLQSVEGSSQVPEFTAVNSES